MVESIFFIQSGGNLSDSMEPIFESYVEVEDYMLIVRVYSSGECESFPLDDIFLRR